MWWRIVEKYQLVKRPQGRDRPDWAAKIHFTIAPCYYHNYMLGELLGSQLHNHLVHKVGNFLRKNIFETAAVYHWSEMIERATGEPLTPKYFVQQFVR